MRKVRKLRHWKQRFDKNAAFIWRKPVFWMGEEVNVADPIPEKLANTPNKLRRFWEAGIIELAEFEEPNVVSGQVERTATEPETKPEPNVNTPSNPEELVTKETDRKWHVTGLDEVFKSKTLALEAAKAMIAEQQAAEKTDEADTDQTVQPDADAISPETDNDDWLEGAEPKE